MARKRSSQPLNLSFLDIMACGFGAVTLLFLIIRHNAGDIHLEPPRATAEVKLLQQEISDAQHQRTELLNSIEQLDKQLVEARGLAQQVTSQVEEQQRGIQSDNQALDKLRKQVEQLEQQTAEMEEVEFGDKVRQFVGEGNRQYLTGMQLGGERVMILLDASASMLADTVVNVVRRRNMSEQQRMQADKWQWALNTTDWLLAQLPASSRFQLYLFNTSVQPAIEGSDGQWLDAADSLQLERAAQGIREFLPADGTSLERALQAIGEMQPPPDNLFLLTDGLPTQGITVPRDNMVSGAKRRDYFNSAVRKIPVGLPINVILFPMEGDPEAAALYWQMALNSRGSFLAPSRDWP